MSTLWIVATPLGNLEDITLRALSVLKSVDAIACEDTRHSLKLFSHFKISKTLISCHAHREIDSAKAIIGWLNAGKDLAYVSDAGTPSLSDPGSKLVRLVHAAGHAVIPVPGPSAFACLMSVAGMGGSSVTFAGFLSPKAGRRRSRLAELMARDEAFVLYESPYRIVRLLTDIVELDPERELCLGREMTKIHEEFIRGSAREVMARIQAKEGTPKGEFSLMVSGKPGQAPDPEE